MMVWFGLLVSNDILSTNRLYRITFHELVPLELIWAW